MKKTQHSIIIKGGIGLNTNDEKIQWHPAFDAALQIEFGDEAKYLEFDPEHLISKKPMQIDVLVKNEKHVKLKKNIGRIFRQYNIIEYKSPEDGSGTGRQRHILPHRDAIPIQLVIVQKLSKEHNYWLNNLRNDLKAGSEIKKITESGLKSIDNTTMTHSSVGDFTYNPKTGAVSKMKGGGHGQANIEFLEANGLEYNIVKVYDNGVRVGVIRTNGRISTIFPDAASQP